MTVRKTILSSMSLLFFLSASSVVLATKVDTLLIVDITGSMTDEINVLTHPTTLANYNNALLGFGHDTRYGLVTFDGSGASLIQDIVDFSAFTAPGTPFNSLSTGATGSANGAVAISTAATASIRPSTYVNMVLLTDAPGIWSPAEANAAISAAQALNASLQVNVSGSGTNTANYLQIVSDAGSFDPSGFPTVYTSEPNTFPILFGVLLPNSLEARIQAGVGTSPVPIPGAIWFLVSALAFLVPSRRNLIRPALSVNRALRSLPNNRDTHKKQRQQVHTGETIRACTQQFPLLIALALGAMNAPANVVYFNDFDGGETFAAGVSGGFAGAGAVESVQNYDTLAPAFSGGFLRNIEPGNPAAASTLSLSGLAPNAPGTVQFSLAIIDSWDGSSFPPNQSQAPDFFNVRINGSTVFSETFTNLSVFNATQSYVGPALAQEVQLGFEAGASRLDSAYLLSVSGISDGSGNFNIDFFASGAGWHASVGSTEETWAVDNISVNNVPLPAAGYLLTIGLAALTCRHRRHIPFTHGLCPDGLADPVTDYEYFDMRLSKTILSATSGGGKPCTCK